MACFYRRTLATVATRREMHIIFRWCLSQLLYVVRRHQSRLTSTSESNRLFTKKHWIAGLLIFFARNWQCLQHGTANSAMYTTRLPDHHHIRTGAVNYPSYTATSSKAIQNITTNSAIVTASAVLSAHRHRNRNLPSPHWFLHTRTWTECSFCFNNSFSVLNQNLFNTNFI